MTYDKITSHSNSTIDRSSWIILPLLSCEIHTKENNEMKELEDYFKSAKEVKKYFNDELFKFDFFSDNICFFQTLNPVFIDDYLVSFKISFYHEPGAGFFCYSNFEMLSNLQLSQVSAYCEELNEQSVMFFKPYQEEDHL